MAQKSNDWHGLATGTHNTLEGVRNSTVQQGISGGLLSVASVASVIGTTAETVSDVRIFRQLVADMTGKEEQDVNSGEALFSTLPYAAEKARGALLSSAAPRVVLEGINTVFNIKMMSGRHVGMLTFLLPMAASQAIGLFTQGNILDVYKEMKKNEEAGQENLPDQYAALIGVSHKELSQRGGASSNFAQELGRIYAERHATVRETLQAVANGQIDLEIKDIIRHNVEAAKNQAQPEATLNDVSAVKANAAHHHHEMKSDTNLPDASFVSRIGAETSQPMVRQ